MSGEVEATLISSLSVLSIMGQSFSGEALDPWEEEANRFVDVLKAMPPSHRVALQEGTQFASPGLKRPTDIQDGNEAPLFVQCLHVDERTMDDGLTALHISALTKDGTTVMVTVKDYEQSFYISAKGLFPRNTPPFVLADWVDARLGGNSQVTNAQLCVRNTSKKGVPELLLKPTVCRKDLVKRCKEIFNRQTVCTYEADIPYLVSFLRTTGIQADSWMEVPADSYHRVIGDNRASTCQVEVQVSYRSIRLLKSEEITASCLPEHVPRRTLSFDIETTLGPMGSDGQRAFPHPQTSSVIQISNILTWTGGSMRVMFTVGECNEIEGAQVFSFNSEELLLKGWFMFVRDVDPDTMTGYNIGKFDLPFIYARAHRYQLDAASLIGRLRGWHPPLPEWTEPRKWENAPIISGRVTLDLLVNVYQLALAPGSRHGLDSIAEKFLGERKIPMDPQDIPSMQEGSPASRRILAIYCLKLCLGRIV